MKYKVRFSPAADRQIDEIYAYIASKSTDTTACKYCEDLTSYCYALAEAPHRGSVRHELRPGIRVIGFRRSASIYFAVGQEVVRILGIAYHGRHAVNVLHL